MSAPPDPFRDMVIRRAGNRCEYCQLPAQLQVGGFEIDHIVPRSHGGQTTDANTALACPHCNARKWAHRTGEDPVSGHPMALFNPRTQRWTDHFQWAIAPAYVVVGRSAHGRATIARLQMNHPDLVSIRRLLAILGLPWCLDPPRPEV